MNIFQKAYCRTFQGIMRFACKFINFRTPQIIKSMGELPDKIKAERIGSVLIVTDDVLHNKLKLVDGLKALLSENGIRCAVYDRTVPNPTLDNIEEAYEAYLANGCSGLIAFGGGSSMDCAKGVGCKAVKPNKPLTKMKGLLKVGKRIPTLFAVPTTAGTGSEATLAAVVCDSATHDKYPINDPVLIPRYAVLEPTLTLGLPKSITSTTGMDALTHAVEAYIGKSNTAATRDWAIRAVKLIFENLKGAYDDGSDAKKRRNMQWAAFYAGCAFTRAYVGYVHALAHSLGGRYGTPHGLANAVILPHVLDWFGASAYAPLSELASAVGIKAPSQEAAARGFILAIKDMNKYMNIPETLDGILEEDIPALVEHAYKESHPLYPVPKFMDREDMRKMFLEISSNARADKAEARPEPAKPLEKPTEPDLAPDAAKDNPATEPELSDASNAGEPKE